MFTVKFWLTWESAELSTITVEGCETERDAIEFVQGFAGGDGWNTNIVLSVTRN